jgi:hypothetical protein
MSNYRKANCMGYALGVNDWLYFYDITYKDAVKVLSKHYNLEPVEKKDMVLGKEYIAYRWGKESNSDFHFMKRGKKGHWRHKIGSLPIEAISQKKVFSPAWVTQWHSYDSKIYLYEIIG